MDLEHYSVATVATNRQSCDILARGGFAPARRSLGGFRARPGLTLNNLLRDAWYEDKCVVFIFIMSGTHRVRRAVEINFARAPSGYGNRFVACDLVASACRSRRFGPSFTHQNRATGGAKASFQ